MTYQPLDRRPIAARETKWAARSASWLVRRGISANGLSIAGMLAGIAAGIAFGATSMLAFSCSTAVFFLTAAACIQLRLLANLLDGMVAVASGTASPVGELYNDVPDRISDAATLIGAGYALGGDPTLGYVAACLALFIAYVRALGKAAGAPQEYCGPMAKQQRMFVLTVLALYCALAPQGWQPIWDHSPIRGLIAAGLAVIIIGGAITAVRRLVRIGNNLRAKKS
jgi:phosphatidylglycerophosphate synthase